jgi:MHS family proline/betaine transporter-like MFS transporter
MNPISNSSLSSRQLLKLSLLANAFEWYEFSVYGYLSALIGQLFFDKDPTTGLLKAFLSLAMGYLARPLGSFYFGMHGDQHGRRYALRLSLLLMAIPTALIGLLPAYDQGGLLSTGILLCLRVMQGFAAGGESPGIACYVFEGATQKYKSILCSSAAVGPSIGMLLGSGVVSLVMAGYDQETLLAWAWRIPFLVSIPLSLFISYFRSTLPETPEFANKKYIESTTLSWKALTTPLLTAWCIFAWFNAESAILKIWMPFYLHHFLGISLSTANLTNTLVLMSLVPLYLLCGLFAQKWGYKRTLMLSIIACLVFTLPLFYALQKYAQFLPLLLIQLGLALIVSSSNGLYVEIVGNLFSFRNRNLGIGLACTLPATIIGGTVPFVCTYILHKTEWLLFPAFYMMGLALLALPFAWYLTSSHTLPYSLNE